MNAFILTCKGRRDLTEQCFKSLSHTIGALTQPITFVVVDAADGKQALTYSEIIDWLGKEWVEQNEVFVYYIRWVDCTLTQGWNRAIDFLKETTPDDADINVLLLQNDSIFLREGWLRGLEDKMAESNIGSIGTSAMSVFGHPFVTGAVQGFKLAAALSIAENGKVIDEHFNHAFPDVDISIRFARAGYYNTLVDDMEHGLNPSVKHFVSQTMYSEHGVDKVMAMRAEEETYFLSKWGNLEA